MHEETQNDSFMRIHDFPDLLLQQNVVLKFFSKKVEILLICSLVVINHLSEIKKNCNLHFLYF